MQTCEICQQNPGQMEFNTPTPLGMFSALICLDCWAKCPGDQAVMLTIVQTRKPLAAAEFDLDPELFSHCEDIPPEIQADVMLFILNGHRCTRE